MCHSFLDATPREKLLRCATFARTGRFRCRRDRATGKRSNARITAGGLTRIPGSAATFLRSRRIPSSNATAFTPAVFLARSATATCGYISRILRAAPSTAGRFQPVPELPKFSERYRIAHLTADLTCSMDTGIVGLMDPAHGPFVHQSWWWRSRRSIRDKQKTFEPIPNGFRMSAHAPSSNSGPYKLLRFYGEEVTTQIDFVLPNVRTEIVRCGKYFFSNRTTVTPIRRDLCRLDFVAAWNLFRWFPVTPFLRFFGKRFIAQDQDVIQRQQPGLKVQPRMMLIDDADRQARWYFQLKAAYLASQQTGMPMTHPLDGPVTLRCGGARRNSI